VRLRHAYFIRCDEVVTNPASGEVVELRCSYDPDSLGRPASAARKRSTAIQWVSAAHALPAEVRLYSKLFAVENPDETTEGKTFKDYLNPQSVEIIANARLEPALAEAAIGNRYQFLRHGYFIVDADTQASKLVFNRIVELPDAYNAKLPNPGNARKDKAEPAPPAQIEVAVSSLSEERLRVRAADAWLAEKYAHYTGALGLSSEQADPLTGSREVSAFFEAALATGASARTVANWVNNEVLRHLKDKGIGDLPFSGADLGELAKLIDSSAVTSAAAKTIYAEMAAGKGAPREIIHRLGLDQSLDAAELQAIVAQVLAGLPEKVAEYRGGKTSLLGMFTGQVMKAAGGKAEPKQVQAALKQQLDA